MHTVLMIAKHVFIEFWALFGVFLFGGALLTYLARWTNNAFEQFLFPRLGFYLFGFIGVPVHEFSHAFFAKVFFHDVSEVKWFDPKAKGGNHGSVTHHYNPWNLYHRVGHFFIGLGPTILGPMVLALAFYLLVPSGRFLFHPPEPAFHIGPLIGDLMRVLASRATLTSPGFYLFAYLAVCVSSQIELSPEDLKQVAIGIFPLLLVLVLANVLSWALSAAWHAHALSLGARLLGVMAGLFAFSALLSALNLAFFTCLFGLIHLVTGRPGINPFLR